MWLNFVSTYSGQDHGVPESEKNPAGWSPPSLPPPGLGSSDSRAFPLGCRTMGGEFVSKVKKLRDEINAAFYQRLVNLSLSNCEYRDSDFLHPKNERTRRKRAGNKTHWRDSIFEMVHSLRRASLLTLCNVFWFRFELFRRASRTFLYPSWFSF